MTETKQNAQRTLMDKRYGEAMATLREKMNRNGRIVDDLLEIFLLEFYHQGVKTGIDALSMGYAETTEEETKQ